MSQSQETILSLSGALNGTLRGDLSCNGQHAAPVRRDDGILPGTPMPLPGSTLPRNHLWADRSLILFADWPDLKGVYDADLLDVLPADATEEDKAQYPRKWVLNAEGDGLLLPDIGGRFSRDWRPEQSDDAQRAAGSKQDDAIRNITGQAYLCSGDGKNYGGVIFSGTGCFNATEEAKAHNTATVPKATGAKRYSYLQFDASGVVPTADENRPLNDAQPIAIYMGRNAADIAPEPPVAPSAGLTLIQRYATAGEYVWTVPDLCNGKPYLVYVRMKGAGAGGHSAGRSHGYNFSGRGGGEGCLVEFDLAVTPGSIYNLTVGQGGAGGAVIPSTGYSGGVAKKVGQAGGDTLFDDISTAPGARTMEGGYKAHPEGRTEIITPGATGGGYNFTVSNIETAYGASGGGNGARGACAYDSAYVSIHGAGGAGGTAVYGATAAKVAFGPGGRGGDGFIEIYTR